MSHPTTTGPGTGHAHGAGYQPAPEGSGYQPAPGGYYPAAPQGAAAPGAPGYQPTPAPGHFGAPVSPRKRSGRGSLIAVVAATALIAAGMGAAVGTIVTNSAASTDGASQSGQPTTVAGAPATGDTHAQDVGLCTRYAIINGAMPSKDTKASDLLPGVTALESSLREFPRASSDIRNAVADMVTAYYARMAAYGPIRTRGLAEPPTHSVEAEKAASDRVWKICGLDQG
jgi:hypothetical protein